MTATADIQLSRGCAHAQKRDIAPGNRVTQNRYQNVLYSGVREGPERNVVIHEISTGRVVKTSKILFFF